MKICRNCGTANINSGQVCFKCHAPLVNSEPAVAQTVSCGNCMAVNAVGAHYCYNCGQSLKAATHFCNSCGANNRPDDVYCSSCGRKILMDNPAPVSGAVPAGTAGGPTQSPEAAHTSLPAVVPGAAPVTNQVPAGAYPQADIVKNNIVRPPSIPPAPNPPQTKRQYRIQLFLMLAALGGMFYLLTQIFFSVQGLFEITGLSSLLILPIKFVPDFGSMLPEFLSEHAAAAEAVVMGLENNFAAIFAYFLFGVLTITAVILAFYLLAALIRFIANKPYNNTRRGLFFLCLINLAAAGLELLAINVEFVKNIFIGEGFGMLFEPQTFFYGFAGGLFVLFIMSRIARVKTPRITRRQRRKAEKKAAKKEAKAAHAAR